MLGAFSIPSRRALEELGYSVSLKVLNNVLRGNFDTPLLPLSVVLGVFRVFPYPSVFAVDAVVLYDATRRKQDQNPAED